MRRNFTWASLVFAVALLAQAAQAASLWGVDPATVGGELVNIDSSTGAVLQRFALPPGSVGTSDTGTGLAGWSGELFYVNDDSNPGQVYVINPSNGSLIRQFSISGGFAVTGLGYWAGTEGAFLYTCGCSVGDMHRYQATDGASPEFFWSTVADSRAVAGDNGGRIFSFAKATSGSPSFEIFEIDPVVNQAPLNSFPAPSQNIVGMAFDGQYLYAADTSGTLYTLNPSNGSVLNSVNVGFTLYALASTEGSPIPPTPGPVATEIPTLSEWGLIILATLMAMFGFVQARRRG